MARRKRDTLTLDLFAPRTPRIVNEGGGLASAPWQPPTFSVLDPTTIEVRPYFRIAFDAWGTHENIGLVADTATGKTYLAYALADAALAAGQRVLFCAPTGVLCEQHAALARTLFRLPSDAVQLIAASRTPKRRAGQWHAGRLCVATPHLTANDLARHVLNLDGVGLVVIDEGHHAARTHASIAVTNAAHARGIRILALTASPGGDLERIERIRTNLHLDRWVRIPEEDTQAFRPPVVERREVIPVADVATPIIHGFGNVLERLTTVLVRHGCLERSSRSPSLATLKTAYDRLRERELFKIIPYAAAAQQLTAALSLVVADDYETAFESLNRAFAKRDLNGNPTRAASRLASTPEVRRAHTTLGALTRDGVRHPKQDALLRVIRAAQYDAGRPIRALVFNRYAAGVLRLTNILRTELGVRVEPALGRSTMRSETLIATLVAFARGEVSIVVGTDVIREGIHVPEIDLLVAYSPPRNERELIQLSGRVGRTHPGEIVTLVANHDVDQRYVFSADAKAERMRTALRSTTVPRGTNGATHRSMFTNHPKKPAEAFVRALQGRFVWERFVVVDTVIEEGHNHKPYVRMLVGDRTGTIPLYHWCPDGRSQAMAIAAAHPRDTVLIVSGTYEDGQSPRITVNPRQRQGITRCPEGDYDPTDYDQTPPF